jgi:hypothetical protein
MDEKIVEQIIDELFASFERSETQSAALQLFLKDQKIATEEKLAPYFEQAGRISEVRWRAARVRMNALIGSAIKSAEPQPEKKKPAAEQEKPDPEKKGSTEEKKDEADKGKQPRSEKKVRGDDSQPSGERTKADDKKAPDSGDAPITEAKSGTPKPEQGADQESKALANPKKDGEPNPAQPEPTQTASAKPGDEGTGSKPKGTK